ncbi:MAG TPA: hypothetical protein VMB20_13625 [Candidatus Acidoferrum sp.]|nr:hypothetical protein [Candidatus Acidoferrum sp.]
MTWVLYGGVSAGVLLVVAAGIIVISPLLRTKRHAQAIAPRVLIAKFQKAQHDLERVQSATIVFEELDVRARVAVARLKAAVEVLRSLRVVPTPNRD